jgi:hypothetical protein
LAIAAMAAAGIVREDWDVAPARTVAMLVVLRTEACAEASRERTIIDTYDFMIARWLQNNLRGDYEDRYLA